MQPWQTAGSVGGRRSNSTPTYVLEYLISELADGTTPAQFEIDGAIPSDVPSRMSSRSTPSTWPGSGSST
jgi:hypothetical protein